MKKNIELAQLSEFLPGLVMALCLSSCNAQMSESLSDPKAGMNGSFEYVQKDLPVNWLVYTKKTVQDGDFDISYDRDIVQDGKQSLKFTVRSCSDKGGRFSPGIAQEIPVKEGEEYRISFWVKSEGAEFLMKINGVNAFDKAEGHTLRSNGGNGQWQEYRFPYKVPEKMKHIRIELNVVKPGSLWVDQLMLVKQ